MRQPELSPQGERLGLEQVGNGQQVVAKDVKNNYLSPQRNLYYPYYQEVMIDNLGGLKELKHVRPQEHPFLQPLFECPIQPNPHTGHVRLPQTLYRISLIVKNETENERKGNLNPAIISLPHWSENQYLLVHRVATDGSYQENLLCEANICYTNKDQARPGEKPCDATDYELFEGRPGFRCATTPVPLNVPATPAENCGKGTGVLMDIPGFHDPRIFWTAKGEPLMMVNSQSRYACFGLWLIDLRKLHWSLETLLGANPLRPALGPVMSYPSLTEITRNPRNTRGSIEKNWMMFGSEKQGSFVHYDFSPTKRTFAKLLGGGITTVNLTDPYEMPCIGADNKPSLDGTDGTWHQGTNSLELVLCDRADPNCAPTSQNSVFFAIIHHKHKNAMSLPLRYERYVAVWSATPPFSMLGISQHPILLANETANGFSADENWAGDPEHEALVAQGKPGKTNWAIFTYTVSIAWAWGRAMDKPQDKNIGYLDDEVILGIGVDDKAMVFTRITARELLQCLRACPGRADHPLSQEGDIVAGSLEIPGFNQAMMEQEKQRRKEEAVSKSAEKAAVAAQTGDPDAEAATTSRAPAFRIVDSPPEETVDVEQAMVMAEAEKARVAEEAFEAAEVEEVELVELEA